MEIRKLKTKGEIMIERAESRFWAYEMDNENTQQDLILLDNVQFIYELSLAELELKALGVNFEVTNGLREFKIRGAPHSLDLRADIPIGPSGYKKATGYPDILFWFNNDPYYLECKTYNVETIETTQRSFYFSPSDEFKVIYDAPHFILSYEIYVAGEKENKHVYKCRHYKILSIESLSLDVKYEFNSDNRRMYSGKDGTVILYEGDIE